MSDWRERTERLIGSDAVKKLEKASVAVAGLGGVGGYAAEALIRAGVGKMVLIDSDSYTESNLNRQIGALTVTVGVSKAVVSAQRARLINPRVNAVPITERIGSDSSRAWEAIVGCDFLADAIDDITAKVLLAVFCKENGIDEISCMGTGNRLATSPFEISDIFSTSGDPLARALRPRLKKAGVERLRCCWSREAPFAADTGRVPASISFVPALAGLTMAGHIIRTIIGVEK